MKTALDIQETSLAWEYRTKWFNAKVLKKGREGQPMLSEVFAAVAHKHIFDSCGEVLKAVKVGNLDEDTMTEKIRQATKGVKIAGYELRTAKRCRGKEEVVRKQLNEEFDFKMQEKGLASSSPANYDMPDNLSLAWTCLSKLNQSAREIWPGFTDIKMRVRGDKGYLEGTETKFGLIYFSLDTPKHLVTKVIGHEWAHVCEGKGLLDEIEENFDGECTSGAHYFGQGFEQIWKAYGYDTQDFEGCLKRLLEKHKLSN